jgi:hypothetical protein
MVAISVTISWSSLLVAHPGGNRHPDQQRLLFYRPRSSLPLRHAGTFLQHAGIAT